MRSKHNISARDWTNPFVVRGAGSCRAFLEAKRGVYPEVFFEFRRLSAPETELALSKMKSFKEGEGEKLIAAMQSVLEERLERWSFGPLDRDRIDCLVHPLMVAMFYVVVGTSPTDPIPEEFLPEGERISAEEEQKKS